MRSLLIFCLSAICLLSALGLVWIRQENRVLIPELHNRYAIRDDLNIEWRELLAQRSVLSRRENLKRWSDGVGDMNAPAEEVVLIIRKHPTDWRLLEKIQ